MASDAPGDPAKIASPAKAMAKPPHHWIQPRSKCPATGQFSVSSATLSPVDVIPDTASNSAWRGVMPSVTKGGVTSRLAARKISAKVTSASICRKSSGKSLLR